MKVITAIDTIGIQIDCNNAYIQREILQSILGFTMMTNSLYVDHKDYPVGMNTTRREYFIYSNNITVATINTGVFRAGSHANNDYAMKYYINIKFAGLKKYNDVLDASSHNCLLMICAYLNTRGIVFKLTELDVCIDAECAYENILAVCTKKSPKTHYHELIDDQVYATTTYIEKIVAQKRDKAVLRAYTYDKSHKEKLSSKITRFEVKLQPKYFNKYGFSIKAIEKALNRYHVMFFENIEEKHSKIEAYDRYKSVQKRELKRLKFNNYRLYADMGYIETFINLILTVNDYNIYNMLLPIWYKN